MPETSETIRLRVLATRTDVKLGGLEALEGRLQGINRQIDTLNRKLKGLASSPFAGASTGTIQQALVLGKGGRRLTPEVVADIIGLPTGPDLNRALAAWKGKLAAEWNKNFKAGVFESSEAGARFGGFALRQQRSYLDAVFGKERGGPAASAAAGRAPASGGGGGGGGRPRLSERERFEREVQASLQSEARWRRTTEAARARQQRAQEVELRRAEETARKSYRSGRSEDQYRQDLERFQRERDQFLNQQGRAQNNAAATLRRRQAGVLAGEQAAGTPPLIPPPRLPPPLPPGPPSGFGAFMAPLRGLQPAGGLAGLAGQFAANTVKVTAWAASVGVLYKSLELASNALDSLIETGYRTARLDQVFSHVGGTTRQLADDVLALAAATGRSSGEALEASIQWARFGLSRQQVAEATRVSLLAANVAEIPAADATEKLSAIFAGFGLTVQELASELGELNQTSNTYNVTVGQMLDGLARTAAVARASGLGLSELNALIGVTVARTGQGAGTIGNAMKTLLSRFANPDAQEKLRNLFRIEVQDNNGEIKETSEILRDVFARYQELNREQRQFLAYTLGGATQMNRVQAVLENYAEAQIAATRAQLNLNSAERENAKITDTVKSRLQGLATEWERLVNQGGGGGFTGALKDAIGGFSETLRVLNELQKAVDGLDFGRALASSIPFLNTWGAIGSALKLAQNYLDPPDRPAGPGAQDLQGQAGAARTAANFLQTAARAAPRSRPDVALKLFRDAAAATYPLDREQAGLLENELRTLYEAGEQQEYINVLLSLRTAKLEEHRDLLDAAARAAVFGESVAEVELRAQPGSAAARQKLEEARLLRQQAFDDRETDPEGKLARDATHLAALEKQRLTLEGIESIYRSIRAVSPMDQFNLELAALEAQKRALTDMLTLYKSRYGDAPAGPEGTEMIKLGQTLRETVVRANALEGTRPLAEFNERFQRGQRRAGLDLLPFAIGANEGDRLLNERRRLTELTRPGRPAAVGAEAQGREMANLLALEKNILDIEERRAKVNQEIGQMAKDTHREMRAALLGAGPGEMLRKLAAFNATRHGRMSGAQFMAFSPEMRREIGLFDPRFSARGMELEEERRRLNPEKDNLRRSNQAVLDRRAATERRFRLGQIGREEYEDEVEAQRGEAAAIRDKLKALGPDKRAAGEDKQLDAVQKLIAEFRAALPAVPQDFLDSTLAAARELDGLVASANAAAIALAQLPALIEAIPGAGAVAPPPAFAPPNNPALGGLQGGQPVPR